MSSGAGETSGPLRTSEVECTAYGADGRPANFVMTPACTCPRCEPGGSVYSAVVDNWARISGRAQRLRVEAVDLGPRGRSVLG
jgi:hypothetical protein